ncbi:TPA: hypothetical protein R5537_001240 [Campylobacter jejuni]|nr:hypothetical protein [Campylobacter jejuni]
MQPKSIILFFYGYILFFRRQKLVLKTNGKFIKTLFLIVVGATIIKVAWDYFS